jgi:uncharacterized protein YbgA (DUF1722 family)/uncharacterized protein YbbK (DUF523 family)
VLGEQVRFNGGHKRDRYVTDVLSDYFDFVPVCPEVAIGLGVPRPPIRLVGTPQEPRVVFVEDGDREVTQQLADYGREVSQGFTDISGFILKSRSPSCGMERVKVYDANGIPSATGSGIFARELMRRRPLLPVEEEGRLNDQGLRGSFLEQVFAYHRWQALAAEGITPAGLVRFHTEHKFLLMAHDQEAMRRLGRMVARAGTDPLEELAAGYITGVMEALRRPARRSAQTNVLQHIAGYLSDALDAGDRQELAETIDAYRRHELPIIAPLTLLRHHLRRLPDAHLERQRYLEPRPRPLTTRH